MKMGIEQQLAWMKMELNSNYGSNVEVIDIFEVFTKMRGLKKIIYRKNKIEKIKKRLNER